MTNFRDEHTFNLITAHTLTDVNSWGGEWRNELQVGNASLLSTELYQPLGPGSRWFLLPGVGVRRSSADVFDGDNVIGRVQSTDAAASLHLGYTLTRLGYVSVGRLLGRSRVDTLIAPAPQPAAKARTDRWFGRVFLDRLDSYAFPKRGILLGGEYHAFDRDDANAPAQNASAASLLSAWTAGRTTLLLNAYAVRATRDGAGSRLGGFLNLSGTPQGRFSGARTFFGSLIGYREMSDLLGEMPAPIYLGASLEAGNSADAAGSLAWDQLKRAGSVSSPPIRSSAPSPGYGRTQGGRGTPYLFGACSGPLLVLLPRGACPC